MSTDHAPLFPLKDMLDVSVCRSLAMSFTRLTGIATAISTTEGEILLSGPWQDICLRFHRQNPVTARRCLESGAVLNRVPETPEEYNIYPCRNGLVDAAFPLVIDGIHLGNLVAGQFILEPLDRTYFERQAEEFGFDKPAYLEALSRVPVYSKEKLTAVMALLKNLTAMIGNAALEKKRLFELNRDLENQVLAQTEALRESDARWKFALEGAGDGLWDWNPQTHQVFFSSQWKKVLGYEPHEIENSRGEWASRVHPEDRPEIEAALEKHFRGETPVYQSEYRLRCKDGSYQWGLDRGKVIEWTEDGKPLRIIGTRSDVSARKKGEVEREELIADRKTALAEVKTLSGMLPICARCKKIRNDQGYWEQIESYIMKHSGAMFTHSLCRECAALLYPDLIPPEE